MGENQYRDFNTGEYAYSEYNCYDAYTGKLIWTLPLETGAAYEGHECIAYGNLYIIPISGTTQVPGAWSYGTFGFQSLGVWCISSTVQDWSMFMADPEHTAEGAGPTNLALKWKFQSGATIVSQPTESQGVTYFGSLDSNIYAVDANTGVKKWAFKTGFQVKSSPAVVNGKLYTGADDGNVYCLDASTGAKLWETSAGGVTKNLLGAGNYLNIAPPVRSSPMVVGNKVYVGTLDGNLYCIDANNGNTVWKFATNGPILATPTIVNGKIYFPSCTGGYPIYLAAPSPTGDFYCLNADSGSVVWHKEIPYVLNETVGWGNYIFASPTVAQGMVYVSNGYKFNYALDANTGATIWTTTQRVNPINGGQNGGVIQMNAPLYKYGKLYFNDYYGISCRNATDGTELWFTYISRENLDQGLTYAYGRVYTVTEFGTLYVLDALTGKKLSYYEFGGSYQMHSSPSLYNGSLYIGCNDMNLYCFGEARLMNNNQPAAEVATTPTPLSLASPTPISPLPTQAVAPPSSSAPTATYIAIIAVVIIVVIAAVAVVVLKRRK
jgi:outer membrane protein assembly factor BamB